MFNNVDGKGFSMAIKETIQVIKEIKPILWFLAAGIVMVMIISAIAPQGLVIPKC